MRRYPFRGIRVRPAGEFVSMIYLFCASSVVGVVGGGDVFVCCSVGSTDTESKKQCATYSSYFAI